MKHDNLKTLIRYIVKYDAMEVKPHDLGFKFTAWDPQRRCQVSLFDVAHHLQPHWILDPIAFAVVAGIVPSVIRQNDSWFDYCEQHLFPTPGLGLRSVFDWIALSDWVGVDSSAIGVAKRLAWLLTRESDGLPPAMFRNMESNPSKWPESYEDVDLDPYKD